MNSFINSKLLTSERFGAVPATVRRHRTAAALRADFRALLVDPSLFTVPYDEALSRRARGGRLGRDPRRSSGEGRGDAAAGAVRARLLSPVRHRAAALRHRRRGAEGHRTRHRRGHPRPDRTTPPGRHALPVAALPARRRLHPAPRAPPRSRRRHRARHRAVQRIAHLGCPAVGLHRRPADREPSHRPHRFGPAPAAGAGPRRPPHPRHSAWTARLGSACGRSPSNPAGRSSPSARCAPTRAWTSWSPRSRCSRR